MFETNDENRVYFSLSTNAYKQRWQKRINHFHNSNNLLKELLYQKQQKGEKFKTQQRKTRNKNERIH